MEEQCNTECVCVVLGMIHQTRMLDMAQQATLMAMNPMLIKLNAGLFDPNGADTLLGGAVTA